MNRFQPQVRFEFLLKHPIFKIDPDYNSKSCTSNHCCFYSLTLCDRQNILVTYNWSTSPPPPPPLINVMCTNMFIGTPWMRNQGNIRKRWFPGSFLAQNSIF